MALPSIAGRVWIVLGLIYLAFFAWYTSFDGPLTPEEIVHYRAVVADLSDNDPERIAAFQRFMETDTCLLYTSPSPRD